MLTCESSQLDCPHISLPGVVFLPNTCICVVTQMQVLGKKLLKKLRSLYV